MTTANNLYRLAGLAACWLLSAPAVAWVSVGSSPGFGSCDYATIGDALADGDNEIRILDNQVFTENLLITGSRTLRGGFSSCLAASLNQQQGSNSEIDGSGASLLPTVSILVSGSGIVTLEELKITGGAVGVATGGATGLLNIRNSLIAANSGDLDGAGVSIGNPGDTLQGGDPRVRHFWQQHNRIRRRYLLLRSGRTDSTGVRGHPGKQRGR